MIPTIQQGCRTIHAAALLCVCVRVYHHVQRVAGVRSGFQCLPQLAEREFMGDEGAQVHIAPLHQVHDVPRALGHIATGADDALLGAGQVEQIDLLEGRVHRTATKRLPIFPSPMKVSRMLAAPAASMKMSTPRSMPLRPGASPNTSAMRPRMFVSSA